MYPLTCPVSLFVTSRKWEKNSYEQKVFVKHVCPLILNVTVTMTFDLETPNSKVVIY